MTEATDSFYKVSKRKMAEYQRNHRNKLKELGYKARSAFFHPSLLDEFAALSKKNTVLKRKENVEAN